MEIPESVAVERSRKYKSVDPFPDIPPALLNSADIDNYIIATGMVYPYRQKDLKSASYVARIKGICKYWDKNGEEKIFNLDKKDKGFDLLPNSIAFIQVEPKFILPDYIALRFNLKINHVYKGLLLGTGPLIDPGFEGHIFIPLHNLTSNTYTFKYDEGLIWIEFTKVSPISKWLDDGKPKVEKTGTYIEFPDDKKNLPLDAYLLQANNGKPIASSIPDAIEKTKILAEEAERSAKGARDVSLLAGFGIFIAIVSMIFSVEGIFSGLERDYAILKDKVNDQKRSLEEYSKELNDLRSKVDNKQSDKKQNVIIPSKK